MDDEAKRIFADYRPELLLQEGGLHDVFGVHPSITASRSRGLLLLAIAHIEDLPDGFDAHELMATIRYWKRELPEEELGPEPLVTDVEALGEVSAAAKRLAVKLDRLADAIAAPASRIADSRFDGLWPRQRRDALREELSKLAEASASREVAEDMRRPNILPGKPPGGWSAREAFPGVRTWPCCTNRCSLAAGSPRAARKMLVRRRACGSPVSSRPKCWEMR